MEGTLFINKKDLTKENAKQYKEDMGETDGFKKRIDLLEELYSDKEGIHCSILAGKSFIEIDFDWEDLLNNIDMDDFVTEAVNQFMGKEEKPNKNIEWAKKRDKTWSVD